MAKSGRSLAQSPKTVSSVATNPEWICNSLAAFHRAVLHRCLALLGLQENSAHSSRQTRTSNASRRLLTHVPCHFGQSSGPMDVSCYTIARNCSRDKLRACLRTLKHREGGRKWLRRVSGRQSAAQISVRLRSSKCDRKWRRFLYVFVKISHASDRPNSTRRIRIRIRSRLCQRLAIGLAIRLARDLLETLTCQRLSALPLASGMVLALH